ncbi:MAG: hypothetical protein ABSB22_24980 [Thermodesulfobacteriota bacterium]
MCNRQLEASEVLRKSGGNISLMSFPQEFFSRFPIGAVQRGHCLVCRKPLGYEEMFPQGKAPRYMCNCCYERIAYAGPKHVCLTCGQPLPAEQIRNQMQNPRELSHAMHSGLCDDYHTILAGIVLGVIPNYNFAPMLPQSVNNNMVPFGQFLPFNQGTSDFIDVEPLKPLRHVKVLKLPE